MNNFPYIGEILSFLTAIIWAIAVIFLKISGNFTKPFSLNLFKNTIASILYILTSLLINQSLFYPAPLKVYFLLATSGVIGIAIADTFFFRALNILGASLTQIVNCLYTPIIILLSFIFLQESYSLIQFIGTAMIIIAIIISSTKSFNIKKSKKEIIYGVILAILAMFLTAYGVIIIKPILPNYPLLWCTEVRIICGVIFMHLFAVLRKDRQTIFQAFVPNKNWKYLIPGSFFGAYLAMIIWLAGIKFTQANIASAINQTNVIFVFVLAAIFLKEKFTYQKLIGMFLALGGALLVSLG